MNAWKKSVLSSVAVGALMLGALGAGPAIAAPPDRLDPGFFFVDCPDTKLRVDYTGKAKTIVHPNGQVVSLSPGLKITVTNVSDTSRTASYTVTGTVRSETLENGSTLYTATGRNFITRPLIKGVYITSGKTTFINDAAGVEEVPFSEPGNVIDLCETLA